MRSLVLASLLAACTVSTGTSQQAIIGGEAAPDDGAVVLLVAYPQDQSTLFACTAVLVSPTALLTVAHCVDHPNFTYGVFYGDDASLYPTLVDLIPHLAPVTSVHMHPSYNRAPPFTADVAMVTLAAVAPVSPLPFARAVPAAGAAARIIGYGQQVYGTYNASRRQAATVLAAIDGGDTVTVGDATHLTCVGDSGGPALVTINGVETVIGVDSYTDTSGCTQAAHFRRADTYAAFIDQYAGTMPDPMGPDAGLPGDSAGDDGDGGGCGVGSGRGGLAIAVLALVLVRRRRR